MKTNKVLAGGLTVFLIIALASGAFAWGVRPGPEKRTERISKRLELTEEQKAIFKAHREKMEAYMKEEREEVKGLEEKLKAELQKDSPDRAVIHDLITKIGQSRTEMQIKRMDGLLELRESLTPEQRKKFKGMLDMREKKGFDKRPRRR